MTDIDTDAIRERYSVYTDNDQPVTVDLIADLCDALEAARADIPECIGCRYYDGPQQECPQHGREYAYWVQRADAAEAERDRYRIAWWSAMVGRRSWRDSYVELSHIRGGGVIAAADAKLQMAASKARMLRSQRDHLAATIEKVRDLCAETDGYNWWPYEPFVHVDKIRAALDSPVTEEGKAPTASLWSARSDPGAPFQTTEQGGALRGVTREN